MEEKKLPEGAIMVGLDIGTTKISVIIGRKDHYGKLDILGTGRAISNGVTRGIVSNIDKTVSAITEAIEEAQKNTSQIRKKLEITLINFLLFLCMNNQRVLQLFLCQLQHVQEPLLLHHFLK